MSTSPPRFAAIWSAVRRRAGDSSEFDLLSRTFLERFFENDIAGGAADLRTSFFWLIAFLAAPGLIIPVLMSFDWDGYAMAHGSEALRVAARGDKVFYLGFTMIATGLLSAITWSSLLLDRRDGLVLGTLPVPGQRIVRAKLTALCVYVVIVMVGMHALASGSYGFFLAAHASLSYAWAGTVAHMVASCAASAFVLFFVAAIQGVLFAIVGPRLFGRISPWLQTAVVATVLLGLMALPGISTATVDTLTHAKSVSHPWILQTPPLWFLGLYETVLRTDDPGLRQLSMTALLSLAAAGLLTIVSYPFAYRRLASSVVAMAAPTAGHGWAGRLIDWTIVRVSRDPATRASSQFFLLTLRRSARQRFAMALALGVTIALVSPTLFRWAPRLADLPASPTIDLLALPFELMLTVLIGLRVAAALPADLNSTWMLNSIGSAANRLRAGVWRTMFLTVVLPASLVGLPLYWRLWGAQVALQHVSVGLLVGAVLIEGLLWGFDGMPCTRPWRPENAALRKWWPAYLALFLFITGGLPTVERWSFSRPQAMAWLLGVLLVTGATLRVTHRRRRMIPEDDLDEPVSVQVLNLF